MDLKENENRTQTSMNIEMRSGIEQMKSLLIQNQYTPTLQNYSMNAPAERDNTFISNRS